MKKLADAATTIRNWAQIGAGGKGAGLIGMFLQGFDWAYGKAVDGLPGFDAAEELAAKYAARHPDPDAAVRALIASQTGMAGTAGFLTGIGGFVSLPAAIPANLASALYLQVRLIAAIAHLRGHDIRSPEVRGLVLACLSGSKAADTLKDAGVRFGARMTRDVLGWASPAVLKKIERAAGVSVTAAAGAGSLVKFGKFMPIVGGIVAAGFDAAMTQLIGRTADRVFKARGPGPPAPSGGLQESPATA
jgi:uncharacterized protein (DUF697 family)